MKSPVILDIVCWITWLKSIDPINNLNSNFHLLTSQPIQKYAKSFQSFGWIFVCKMCCINLDRECCVRCLRYYFTIAFPIPSGFWFVQKLNLILWPILKISNDFQWESKKKQKSKDLFKLILFHVCVDDCCCGCSWS